LPQRPASRFSASSHVALGILLSRLTGLAKERAIGHYFGVDSIVADALRQSIRIPNLLSNLFGEGVLSASFVTVYAKLRARGEDAEARHLAAAVFGILSLACSLLVLAGVAVTPLLIDLIAPGFKGEERTLTIHLVRILFPGTGLLVLSAWCLGVLNSHHRFLLSYMAPIASNVTVIAVLIWSGQHLKDERLVVPVAWAVVAGSALQFLVQLPRVLKLLPGFRPAFDATSQHVRSVFRNFGPIFLSRGVVQISSYIDSMIASLLPVSAVAALGYGQVISILPISLFSMSVSAAELPALSSATGSSEEIALFLRSRLSAGLRRIAFLIVPSAAAFLLLGDVLVAAIYQSGRFHYSNAVYVWAVLAGSAVGLLATALGRLYSSAFYSLLDTRTPLRFAVIRVVLTVALGFPCALFLPGWIGIDPKWGVAGLTVSAGIAGWVEFALLRNALGKRIGETSLPASFTARLWAIAFFAGGLAYLIKLQVGTDHPILRAALALPLYGGVYFAGTAALGITEARSIFKSLRVFR
jgi:putative peptidoglycan lipid II flippase